jgi:hypothetical protein
MSKKEGKQYMLLLGCGEKACKQRHCRELNYYLNEPTTWGLENPEQNRFRYHQRRILAMDLAGTRVE